MEDVDGRTDSRLTGQVRWLGLRVGGHLALSLHSSNELGELSQWPRHDDSIINIVTVLLDRIAHTAYIDAVYCYCPSSVVCWSVGLFVSLSVALVSPAKTAQGTTY